MNRAVRLAVYAIGFIVGFILMGLLHGCAAQPIERHQGMHSVMQVLWIDADTLAFDAEKDFWFASYADCAAAVPEVALAAKRLAQPNEAIHVTCLAAKVVHDDPTAPKVAT